MPGNGPVGMQELVAMSEDGVDEHAAAPISGFAEALALCRARQFGAALEAFESLAEQYPEDGPTAVDALP